MKIEKIFSKKSRLYTPLRETERGVFRHLHPTPRSGFVRFEFVGLVGMAMLIKVNRLCMRSYSVAEQ